MIQVPINETGTYYVVAKNTISGYVSLPSNNVRFISLSKCYKTISDVFPDPYDNGIFELIRNSNTQLGSFLTQTFPKSVMDVEYVFKRSGSKRLSVLFEGFFKTRGVQGTTFPLNERQIKIICNIFNARYYEKWTKAYQTIIQEFDPLSPYNMSITDDTQDTFESEDSSQYNDTSSDNESTYGFNSISATPTNSSNGNNSGSSSNTRNRTNTIDRDITRKGNIGNVTLQNLTAQQREMLQWQLFDVIFADTDKLLTRPTYG